MDKDLKSIQEVRDLLERARSAQEVFARFSQKQIDVVCREMARSGRAAAERLARLAVEETGFGVIQDKITKNIVATELVHRFIQPMQTVGVISRDLTRRVYEIAEPMGVVAGIIPSTNPTSTAMYKILISLKARNAIVLSPHPSALKCIMSAMDVMNEAAVAAGAPEGLIGCMSLPTQEGTHELMTHRLTSVILATGGSAMVKAAYSSGKPAYGVGPGNVPVFIERSAEVRKAVADIIVSKTFDNGTVCASEQAIVTDEPVHELVVNELKRSGCFFLTPEQEVILGEMLVSDRGTIKASCVGQSAKVLAERCGFQVPPETRVLLAQPGGVGPAFPLSREKLSPVIALYRARNWQDACEKCMEIIQFGGIGHTMGIHSRDDEIIMEFALKKPVFRIIANSPTTHGAVGFSTGLSPALTLGCGTWGGSATSDNVSPLHLINIKRLAYGIHDVHDQQAAPSLPVGAAAATDPKPPVVEASRVDQSRQPIPENVAVTPRSPKDGSPTPPTPSSLSESDIRDIVSRYLSQLRTS